MPRSLPRLSALMLTAVIAVVTMQPSFAQVSPGANTVGPAGGVSSTTAPSNSAGTPAGGTGVIGTTRVGPSTVAPAPMQSTMPSATVAPSTTAQAPARRRVRHRRVTRAPRQATEVGTQSQSGLNGSAAPSR